VGSINKRWFLFYFPSLPMVIVLLKTILPIGKFIRVLKSIGFRKKIEKKIEKIVDKPHLLWECCIWWMTIKKTVLFLEAI
jgi:hypothetical protein